MLNALQRRVEHVDHIACSLTVPHASKRGKRARTTPGKPTVSGSVVRIDRASVVLRRLFLCGFCILPDLIRRVCLISRAFFLFRKRICLYHRLYFKRVIRHELFEEVAIHFFMVIQVMGNLMPVSYTHLDVYKRQGIRYENTRTHAGRIISLTKISPQA